MSEGQRGRIAFYLDDATGELTIWQGGAWYESGTITLTRDEVQWLMSALALATPTDK